MSFCTFKRLTSSFEKFLKWIAAFSLISMAIATGIDILSRTFFNYPLYGVEEIISILAILTTGFSLSYAHSERSNIGVDLIFSKISSKKAKLLILCTNLVSFLIFSIISWRLVLYAISLKNAHEITMTLELPTHNIVLALAVGFAAFSLTIFKDVISFFVEDK